MFKSLFGKKTPPSQPPTPQPAPEPLKQKHPAEEREFMERVKHAYGDVLSTLVHRYIFQRIPLDEILAFAPPKLAFSDSPSYLKVLPGPDNKLPDMERFWNSLRPINQPISFEIIRQTETMYFRLSFPQEAANFIEQQLSLHFPECVVIPEERPYEITGAPFYSVCLAPGEATGWIDSSSVARDPYAKLFSILDDPLMDDVGIQIICCPVPDQAIQAICKFLEWKEPGIPPKVFLPVARSGNNSHWSQILESKSKTEAALSHAYLKELFGRINTYDEDLEERICKKIVEEVNNQVRLFPASLEQARQLEKKRPVWVGCVNMFCSYEETSRKLYGEFLGQYTTLDQSWKSVRIDEMVDPISHPIKLWNLIATSELADLAHFPTANAQSTLLETATAKHSAPPDSYIVG
jgi:hypothetical protein